MDKIIGIGEYGFIHQPGDRLLTHALATCVAVVVFCKRSNVAGMIHIALPEGEMPIGSLQKQGYFASTGLPKFLEEMRQLAACSYGEMTAHVIGGAESSNSEDLFHIALRNIEKVTDILKAYGVNYCIDEVGGSYSRTLILDLDSGEMEIKYQKIIL